MLFAVGSALEPLVGRGWFALLFAASALAGAAFSAAFLDARVASVGASGAIIGLIGGLFALAGRLEPRRRNKLRWRAAALIVPALLPLGSTNASISVDYTAHIGGLAAGALIAVVIGSLWRGGETPPYAKAAGALGAAYFVVAAAAIIPIARAWAALAPY
jgi:rhomboid protease GluP